MTASFESWCISFFKLFMWSEEKVRRLSLCFFFLVCFFYYYSNINTHTPDLFTMSFNARRRREKYKKKSLEYNYYSVWKSIEEKSAKRICFVFNWNEEKKPNGKWNANKNKKFTWIVWLFFKISYLKRKRIMLFVQNYIRLDDQYLIYYFVNNLPDKKKKKRIEKPFVFCLNKTNRMSMKPC